MQFLSALSPSKIRKDLHRGGEASTFERLSTSRHVADLRLIFSITVIIAIVASVLAVVFCFADSIIGSKINMTWMQLLQLALSCFSKSGRFIGAIGAVGCGVLTWTYQRGSARLGVVDLFACEIATLCNVVVVADVVARYVAFFRDGPGLTEPHDRNGTPTGGAHFTSQESYFPVFDSSVKDLQQLEADVVQNVTAFYTYMKVMRDYLRKLADIHPPAVGIISGHDDWNRTICDVIYMQFLGLESARKAIKDLVEFQPTRAEDIFTILLSELGAYAFLREQFKGDLFDRLLKAREEKYRRKLPRLYHKLKKQTGPQWNRAKEIADEAMSRYQRIFQVAGPAGAPFAAK